MQKRGIIGNFGAKCGGMAAKLGRDGDKWEKSDGGRAAKNGRNGDEVGVTSKFKTIKFS